MVDQRLKFETYCLSVGKKKNSKILTNVTFDELVNVLNGSITPNPNIREKNCNKNILSCRFPKPWIKKNTLCFKEKGA